MVTMTVEIEDDAAVALTAVAARTGVTVADVVAAAVTDAAFRGDEELVAGMPVQDADALVREGLAALERGDDAPQEEVFARWRTKYG